MTTHRFCLHQGTWKSITTKPSNTPITPSQNKRTQTPSRPWESRRSLKWCPNSVFSRIALLFFFNLANKFLTGNFTGCSPTPAATPAPLASWGPEASYIHTKRCCSFQREENNSIYTIYSGQRSKLFYASVHTQTASMLRWRKASLEVSKYSGIISKIPMYKYKLQGGGFVLQLEVNEHTKEKAYLLKWITMDCSILIFKLSGKGSWGKI